MNRGGGAGPVARRVLVSGQVQGVGFRMSCARRARARLLAGFVRNLPDGRVEALFSGDAGDVDDLVSWCRYGPAGAAVTAVAVEDVPAAGHTGFEIR